MPIGKGSVKKFFKKVGKVTSPFTTAAAKMFIPAGLVNAAANLDPTKKGTKNISAVLQQAAAQNLTAAPTMPAAKPAFFDRSNLARNIAIFGGGAIVLGGVVYAVNKKRNQAAAYV